MENKENYIKATKEGKLYIETKDFFKQKRIKEQIVILSNSNIAKEINNKGR